MAQSLRGGVFSREELAQALVQFPTRGSKNLQIGELGEMPMPARCGLVASWSQTAGDPLAELLVVRDEDFNETITWLNSFFAGISPVTQWCRIITRSEARRLGRRADPVTLGLNLGPWVGAIVAEGSVQGGGTQNLRELPGSASASTATFAAGRAVAVWGPEYELEEIADRHHNLSLALRENHRPLAPNSILPIWAVLSGRLEIVGGSTARNLEPFFDALVALAGAVDGSDPVDLVDHLASALSSRLQLPELLDCARGPQIERVRALDRLAQKVGTVDRVEGSAVLGIGASFIEAGVVVSSELLKRYASSFQTAAIWQGVFAGAVNPARVLNDHGGLGRLVSKSLLAQDDLSSRPTSDIAFAELIRWITPGRSLKMDVRGMSSRTLSVEIALGVTSIFPFGKSEVSAQPSAQRSDSRVGYDRARSSDRIVVELERNLEQLSRRVEALEAEQTRQGSLDLSAPKVSKTRRKS